MYEIYFNIYTSSVYRKNANKHARLLLLLIKAIKLKMFNFLPFYLTEEVKVSISFQIQKSF